MGFAGWDGPKEHKLRKNKKAFTSLNHYYKYRETKQAKYKGNVKYIGSEENRDRNTQKIVSIIKSSFAIIVIILFVIKAPLVKKTIENVLGKDLATLKYERELKRCDEENKYRLIIDLGDRFIKQGKNKKGLEQYMMAEKMNCHDEKLMLNKISETYFKICQEDKRYCDMALILNKQIAELSSNENEWILKRQIIEEKLKE